MECVELAFLGETMAKGKGREDHDSTPHLPVGGANVLVVSRSEILRRDLGGLGREHENTRLEAVTSVESAVARLESDPPDRVVLDVDDLRLLAVEFLSVLQVLDLDTRVCCISNRLDAFQPYGRSVRYLSRQNARDCLFAGSDEQGSESIHTGDFLDICRLANASATLRLDFEGPKGRRSWAEYQIFEGAFINAYFARWTGRAAVAASRDLRPRCAETHRLHSCPIEANLGEASVNSKPNQRNTEMAKVNLDPLSEIDGFIGACLADSDSGMVLGLHGGTGALDVEIAASGNSEVVKAKRATMSALNLDDAIEDILISLSGQYHIIRPVASNNALFFYLALDRKKANLAMARHSLRAFEETFKM